jgi:hypothetical protein
MLKVDIKHLIKTALSMGIRLSPILLQLTNQKQEKISGVILPEDEKRCMDWLREERYWDKRKDGSLDEASFYVFNAIEDKRIDLSWQPCLSTIKSWIRNSGLQPQTAKVRGPNKETIKLGSMNSC